MPKKIQLLLLSTIDIDSSLVLLSVFITRGAVFLYHVHELIWEGCGVILAHCSKTSEPTSLSEASSSSLTTISTASSLPSCLLSFLTVSAIDVLCLKSNCFCKANWPLGLSRSSLDDMS